MSLVLDPSLALSWYFETDDNAWTTTLHLSDRFRLTVYDAAYLELAQRRRLPLASLDQPLCRAAIAPGLTVLSRKST